MLENGDLIFVREDTEMGQAIQAAAPAPSRSTGTVPTSTTVCHQSR